MTQTASQMSALLGSRICHDLISPLGAIGNGVELLQMSGLGDSPELSLITESVENANARIKLFRLAFGAPSPGQHIARSEIRDILAPIGAARRMKIDWPLDRDLLRDEARLAFLLLLCCETMLPWGGQVDVVSDETSLRMRATAERMRDGDDLWNQLTTPDAPIPAASEIHFPLARDAAVDLGRVLNWERSEKTVILTAAPA